MAHTAKLEDCVISGRSHSVSQLEGMPTKFCLVRKDSTLSNYSNLAFISRKEWLGSQFHAMVAEV
uniref:Uncharacterized protein n=1 Tax=Nelumbo nucifera TaxID=4432 RepID=A0A822XTL7_NELNU|nr:TPA_asm: hypothetical protein HUJ06_026428 [Nelumbo nucifera]